MLFKAVYIPKGKAQEYCPYALNIYDGCPHRCYYCYAPQIRHKMPEDFHDNVTPYRDIVERTRKDCESGELAGKTVQLCFTCDPYPSGIDTMPTREVIKCLKAGGAHVQILTKAGMAATRDFDLLDSGDKFGVTLTAFDRVTSVRIEPGAETPSARLNALDNAKMRGIGTWVSFEPVIRTQDTLSLLDVVIENKLADTVKIGKMNYFKTPEPIDWGAFGRVIEAKCRNAGQDYYIKQSLRAEMEK